MSDRTKFFSDKDANGQLAREKKQREADAAKQAEEMRRLAVAKATDIYQLEFEKLANELREDGLNPSITRTEDATNIVTVVEAAHPQKRYEGKVSLSLRFRADNTKYELVYVTVEQPSVLGMLAWRQNDAPTFYVGMQSKTPPRDLPQVAHVVAHHMDLALSAMK